MEELFRISKNKDEYWEMKKYHFHTECEVMFVLAGECHFLMGNEIYKIGRGSILPVPRMTPHKSQGSHDYTRYALHFSEAQAKALSTSRTDLLRIFHNNRGVIQLDEEHTLRLEQLFEACRKETVEYGDDLLLQNAFVELLVELGRLSMPQEEKSREKKTEHGRLNPVLSYIKEHISEELTLKVLSEQLYMSRQHLCRLFKENMGITAVEYITAQRLRLACRYLEEGASVQQSGEDAGFGNNAHFIRVFKREMGVSPGVYRKHIMSGQMLPARVHQLPDE